VAADDEMITIAFADPADKEAISEVAFFVGRAVAPAIAPPSAIRAELERRFGLRVLLEARLTLIDALLDTAYDEFSVAIDTGR
jgi:hypothetical protein